MPASVLSLARSMHCRTHQGIEYSSNRCRARDAADRELDADKKENKPVRLIQVILT